MNDKEELADMTSSRTAGRLYKKLYPRADLKTMILLEMMKELEVLRRIIIILGCVRTFFVLLSGI